MAFFKKLKDRLFKSSSKIEEGLDAIVEDGGVEEEAQFDAQAGTDAAEAAQKAAAEQAKRDKLEADAAAAAEAAAQAEAARQAEAAAAALRRQEEVDRAEAARQVAEDEAARAAAAAQAQADADALAAAEAARVAAERAAAEAEAAEAARQAEVAARAEADRQAAEQEAARKAAEDAAAQREAERVEAAAAQEAAKPGLLGRLLGRGDKKTVVRRELDDDMLEQLEELLISADMGVDTALRVTANMAEGRFGKRLSTAEIKGLLADEVTRIMEPVARPMPLYPTKPQVVLVVGVNGSGKTTTIGKLASQFQAAGKKVVIAAGDTFRAAAVEQLQVWGARAGVPVLTAPEGSDPASLAFDAMEQAARDGADLLMIDTAGRLQNRADLMEELSKIVRVIRKKDADAPHNTLLVLDATTGQNALSQVKTFQELADVTGLVMTKLDGTAKGGVLVALADKFGLPIHAIGVGEQIDDLAPFDPEDFAAALMGTDR
ncbi:signal recognition particle-docking protein FtsY [Pseudooctadecabacter jejudonensis]|uniref:Signal recognition particle receptor FtsY n=1 Tax=Pseudooctadecabacter jejudonensis TaxID=1391910 RepID=A0A1Y5RP28_9RHOB|nr:signal recognition particle-docking protein FtsY [Pseudooctadecabacter jejudonensis]SLN22163.1 Signal recognition particle receptor FtsY [Pseudooctadecabacter jejudonensis]